jgi:hypothetical protein
VRIVDYLSAKRNRIFRQNSLSSIGKSQKNKALKGFSSIKKQRKISDKHQINIICPIESKKISPELRFSGLFKLYS